MAQSNTNQLFFGKKMTLSHLLTWRLLPAVIVMATLVAGCFLLPPLWAKTKAGLDEQSPQRVYVRTTTLQSRTNFTVPIWYTGQVNARRKTAVGFQRNGKVTQLHFDEGDFVVATQAIANLDNRQLLARIQQLNAETMATKARRDEMIKGPRVQAIRSADANVDDLEQQLENAKLDFDRAETLLPKGAVSQQEYDQAKYRVSTLSARKQAALAQLEELNVGTRIEQVDAAEAALLGAQAANLLAEHDLDDCTLRAPFSGTITQRMVDEGAVLESGQPVVELVESQYLEFRVGLPVELVRTMNIGDTFQVKIDKISLEAKLKSKLLALDENTQTQTIIMSLDDSAPHKGIVDNQMGRLRFDKSTNELGFLIPTSAIVNDQQGLWNCYTIEKDGNQYIAKRQVVEVLHFQGDNVFVRGTLSNGQPIVVDGLQRLANGQIVQLLESEGASQ